MQAWGVEGLPLLRGCSSLLKLAFVLSLVQKEA